MIINEVINNLISFGLSKEEALMYCFLLQEKSATVAEIYQSPYFSKKKRPNLYKIIKNLKEKGFLFEEMKKKKKRFFPLNPQNILNLIIQEKEMKLQRLKQTSEGLILDLDTIVAQPNTKFDIMPPLLKEIVSKIKKKKWIIKEIPEVHNASGMETVMSVEFDTRRNFRADSAGIVIFKYRYKEHLEEAIPRVIQKQEAQFQDALENVQDQLPFGFEEIKFSSKILDIDNTNHIPYRKLEIKTKFLGKMHGGFTVLKFHQYPTVLLSIWSANLPDFKEILTRTLQNYQISSVSLEKD
ncbi:hypothetical protein NEF87_003677 [Candidatus Lokiarchaeum ossiferum]|uniref:Transcription regulator TrmB N-terminal domain-containing protein n=1 Tax=Candidatus Lokiarchaeum ossiferum TaxID=2951803 RepID=A0ABY6HYJ3_9ARCH|nr:hypothetical protein NEF87_003677 [Candidatus Lokiarchaeum sp. B-35]